MDDDKRFLEMQKEWKQRERSRAVVDELDTFFTFLLVVVGGGILILGAVGGILFLISQIAHP